MAGLIFGRQGLTGRSTLNNYINTKSYFYRIAVLIAISIVFSGLGAILSDVAEFSTIARYLKSPLLFALNTLPLTLLLLFLYHLTSRLWISFGLGGGLFLLMQTVNRFKMTLREEPLTLEDFVLGAEAANVVKLSELPVSFIVVISFILLAAVVVGLFICFKPGKLRWPLKTAGVIAAVLIFVFSFNGIYKNQTLYNSFKVNGSIYSQVNKFKSRGFAYSFMVRARSYRSVKPENYAKSEARQTLAKYEGNQYNESRDRLPHIIAVMGEAFYNIDRIKGIEFNDGYDPLKNFNLISKKSYSGSIVTNVFGGGTANTEFAFLTGHSISIMPNMGSPYINYLRKDTFSMARVLEKYGYSTLAFHPGDSWFYNRINVYDFFGFDKKYFKKDMDLIKVATNFGYISDMDTAEFALEKFRTHLTEKLGVPLFEFVVNIDNHGPYAKYDLGFPEILKGKSDMDTADYYTVNNYINGLARCDQALGAFADFVDKSDEPVVFLFFGDHLPYLGENFAGYKALGFNISQTGNLEAYLNHYETPFFIYSNQAAKSLLKERNIPVLTGEAPLISSNYLGTELLDYIGLNGGTYFNFLSDLKKSLPVITDRFYDEKGTFTENINAESKLLVDQYRKLQYYMLMEPDAIK